MILIAYVIGFSGIVLQALNGTEIVPGVPDRVTMGLIVFGLAAANVIQWRQGIKDRDRLINDKEVSRKELIELVKNNTNVMRELILKLDGFGKTH